VAHLFDPPERLLLRRVVFRRHPESFDAKNIIKKEASQPQGARPWRLRQRGLFGDAASIKRLHSATVELLGALLWRRRHARPVFTEIAMLQRDEPV
jgi:hypothetical protein